MDDDYYDDYFDDYYTDGIGDLEMFEPRFENIWYDCIWPTLTQISILALKFITVNFLFRILTQTFIRNKIWSHLVSTVCGAVLIFLTVETGFIYIYGLVILSYGMMWLLHKIRPRRMGFVISCFVLGVLLSCEYMEKDKRLWHQLRGCLMIVVMKIISLAFDIDATKTKDLPRIVPFMGYVLCPASVIFGPWHSFNDYTGIFETSKWNLKYVFHIFCNTTLAITFLLVSNCFIYGIISDNTWKWVIAYRDALAFRSSHYFVSFMSQMSMTTAGFITVPSDTSSKYSYNNLIGYEVTKPHKIEFPRSLLQVVVGWNIPMHNWLKQYVFRVIKPHSTFLAVFSTYLISSILHGLNLQLSAVLLSLGLYTYVEYKLRQKLSTIYNSCTLPNKCKPGMCNHDTKSHFNTFLNALFALLTVFHLAYLGVMFEAAFHIQEQGYSLTHALEKWSKLDFASHWTILISYLFYLVI
ncbi:protein-serine O-palmitoleoyltransferase porcupine [Culicoides brevitarsis]|uniref:protein-serine O-palmitoleoyltransferase porcupine n=1 Tax=Culicoides brevitarsis TaxID=469753 RepID=UPI00307B3B37